MKVRQPEMLNDRGQPKIRAVSLTREVKGEEDNDGN